MCLHGGHAVEPCNIGDHHHRAGRRAITYENGLGLAIGANIGTTITAILGAWSSNVMLFGGEPI